MKVKQLGESEIQALKAKALALQRRAQAMWDTGKSQEALNTLSDMTRILTWIELQEGNRQILKDCIEVQSEKRENRKPINPHPSPKHRNKQYRLTGPQPPQDQTKTYRHIFSYGHKPKPKSQGRVMPNRITFKKTQEGESEN